MKSDREELRNYIEMLEKIYEDLGSKLAEEQVSLSMLVQYWAIEKALPILEKRLAELERA
ncbi:MAG: hypothetical protein ACFFDT_18665 [Candidatus Hodarchaeota archaeon]